jgi:hypothetical protein
MGKYLRFSSRNLDEPARGVRSPRPRPSVSLAMPLWPCLISSYNSLNTTVKEETVTLFLTAPNTSSLFLCSCTSRLHYARRRLIAAAADQQKLVS